MARGPSHEGRVPHFADVDGDMARSRGSAHAAIAPSVFEMLHLDVDAPRLQPEYRRPLGDRLLGDAFDFAGVHHFLSPVSDSNVGNSSSGSGSGL